MKQTKKGKPSFIRHENNLRNFQAQHGQISRPIANLQQSLVANMASLGSKNPRSKIESEKEKSAMPEEAFVSEPQGH
ncbi:hypothetical protein RRG08_039866 [Elysia crispata]|uniref:Uncharacterized protein n=1 Tax=Elysia crispata TaxID=231223 RepID=A0AAE0ZX71_9GAST|nr:hypothetical protein RRG08_039866 [Elysia crispata]